VAEEISDTYQGNITKWSVQPNSDQAIVFLDSCKKPITVTINQSEDNLETTSSAVIFNKAKQCKEALR
jgi:hypothetical protein